MKGGSCPARRNEVTLAIETHLVIVRVGIPAREGKGKATQVEWPDRSSEDRDSG